jgi:HAD superfamily hydrolase (TIGR01490 family)
MSEELEESSRRPARIAVFFDVDGTLLKSNIVEYLVFFQKRLLLPWRWRLWMAGTVLKVPVYLALDHWSRSAFCRFFYRGYRGVEASITTGLARRLFDEVIRPRIHTQALQQIDTHREQGHTIVLLTGSLDFIMQPLAEFIGAHYLIAARLEERDGRFTGRLMDAPLSESGKAEAVFRLARAHGIDYRNSFAYADSFSDLNMLECVGNPVAVNPDRRLRALARQRGWRIYDWARK